MFSYVVGNALSNIKLLIKAYPDSFCLGIGCAINMYEIYYGNSNDLLFTLGSSVAGLVFAPVIEIISYTYDLRGQVSFHEIVSSNTIISAAVAGVATGSFLGSMTARLFDKLPQVTFNGLIFVVGSLLGATIGHLSEIYFRPSHEDDVVSTLVLDSTFGAAIGAVVSLCVIYKLHNFMDSYLEEIYKEAPMFLGDDKECEEPMFEFA